MKGRELAVSSAAVGCHCEARRAEAIHDMRPTAWIASPAARNDGGGFQRPLSISLPLRHLHHRERLRGGRPARRRRRRPGRGPDHVPAKFSDPASPRDIGRRAGARLFPLESHGQFRVGERLRIAVRIGPRRLYDLEADAEAQRLIFPGGSDSEPGSVTAATEAGGGVTEARRRRSARKVFAVIESRRRSNPYRRLLRSRLLRPWGLAMTVDG